MKREGLTKTKSGREILFSDLRRERFQKRLHQLRDCLMFFIPIDIPKPVQLLCGVFNVCLVLTIFVCLFYFGFTSIISTVYLSPLHGNKASPNCELIPQTNSGEYLATQTGEWEGNPLFTYPSATYRISLTSHTLTQRQYDLTMNMINDGLKFLGEAMKQSDLSKNVMIWMSLVFANSSAAAQRFSLTGTPDSVFNRQFFDADIGSVEGRCNISSTTTYDRSSHTVKTRFKIDSFRNDSICSSSVDVNRFGYNYLNQPEDFDIEFDMRTLITAAAINYGLLAVRNLALVPDRQFTFTLDGETYVMTWTYDPKYPGMDPIYCTAPGAYEFKHPVCVMTIADMPLYPILLHTGKDLTYPRPCLCGTLTIEELLDPAHRCHLFDFEAGFIFWNTYELSPYFEVALRMAAQPYFLDNSFYAASSIMKYWSNQPAFQSNFNSMNFRKQAFSFCNTVSSGYCSMYILRAYDLSWNFQSQTVSPYYHQLERGACRDSITAEPEQWYCFSLIY